MNHAHGVFDRYELRAGGLDVEFGAAEARQDERLVAGHEMAAVEFCRDLSRQTATAERLGGVLRVGRGGKEIAAHR